MSINKVQHDLAILLVTSCIFALVIPRIFTVSSYFLFFLIYLLSYFVFKDIRRLIVYGFALNVTVAIIIYKYYQSIYGVEYPYYIGGSDDLMYELSALDFSHRFSIWEYNSILGNIVPVWHNSPGYIFLVSLIVRFGEILGGYHTIMPRLINLFFLNFIAYTTFKICKIRLQLSRENSLLAAALILILPLPVYLSSHIFRDTFVSLLYLSSLYLLMSNKLKMWHIFYIISCIVVISQLRYITSIFLILTLVFFRLDYVKNQVLKVFLYSIAVILLGALLIKLDIFILLDNYSENYSEYRSTLSTVLAAKIFNIPLPLGLIPRMLYYVATPVPQFSNDNIISNYLSLGTAIQMLAFPFMMITCIENTKLYVKNKLERTNVFLIIVVFLILWIGLSATTFSERHMIIFYPLAIILTVYGFSVSKFIEKNKILILVSSLYTALIMMIGYALIK